MKPLRCLAVVLCLFSPFLPLFADSPSALQVASVLPGGLSYKPGEFLIVSASGQGAAPALLPRYAGLPRAAAKDGDRNALRIEALAVLPAPARLAGADETLGRIALIMNSVGRMKGIEYWSASRGKMRTLYEESYRVDSVQAKTRLPDPASLEPATQTGSWTFFAFQKDLTFGGNVMRYEISSGDGFLSAVNRNETTMRYYLLPLVPPGGLESSILVLPCKDGLVVHFVSTVRAPEIAAKRVFESAGNKALSVLGWFAREAAAAGLAGTASVPVNIEEVPVYRN